MFGLGHAIVHKPMDETIGRRAAVRSEDDGPAARPRRPV